MQFGRGEIPVRYTKRQKAQTVILPAPYEGTVSYGKGAAGAPRQILKASHYLEFYDEELDCLPYTAGIHTLTPLRPPRTPAGAVKAVETAWRPVLNNGRFPIMIGGEHTLSIGLFRALQVHYPDLQVLQFDAHADLRTQYRGSRYNHACTMRRILDSCPQAVQVGIRSISLEEKNDLPLLPTRIFYMHKLRRLPNWPSRIARTLKGPVFITIDLDSLDPAVLPHTGTPEPGGLLWHELLDVLKAVFRKVKVAGCDVMELASGPSSRRSDFLAARLIYKLIAYRFNLS